MARFSGNIGYATNVEVSPGVWVDQIVEYSYFGDVIRDTKQNRADDPNLNGKLSVQNLISVVADEYANEHFFAIAYVEWAGTLWTIQNVEVQRPRLLLRLGEVYNGPTAAAT